MDVDKALNILLITVILSAAWFILWTSIMGVNARWRKEKREYDKDKAQHERIIVKKNEDERKLSELEQQIADKQAKLLELEEAEAKIVKRVLNGSISSEAKNVPEDNITTVESEKTDAVSENETRTLDELTVVELRTLARDRNIKGFSRMSKDELITKLGLR